MIDTIICGDCLEVMPTIPDKSVDMILADLPYGVTACKWDTPLPLDKLWSHFRRIRKKRTPILLFGTEPFSSNLRMSNIVEFKYDWVWDKVWAVGFQVAKYRPMMRTENISVFGNGAVNYYPIMERREVIIKSKRYTPSNSCQFMGEEDGLIKRYTHKYPKNILVFSNANQTHKVHPTQKPVALFEYLIRTYTNEGDTVLDPTAGSGTTAVACRKSNRHYICIEKEPEYCDIAEKRIKEML